MDKKLLIQRTRIVCVLPFVAVAIVVVSCVEAAKAFGESIRIEAGELLEGVRQNWMSDETWHRRREEMLREPLGQGKYVTEKDGE